MNIFTEITAAELAGALSANFVMMLTGETHQASSLLEAKLINGFIIKKAQADRARQR